MCFSHPRSERNSEKQLMPLTREKDLDKELMIPLTHKDFKLYSQKNPLKRLGQQQHAVVFRPCRVPGQFGGGLSKNTDSQALATPPFQSN